MKRKLLDLIHSRKIAGVANPVYPLMQLGDAIRSIRASIERLQTAIGRIEARLDAISSTSSFADHEFQVHSQWGEDGLIQHLIRTVEIPLPVFVEFGVEDYREANTRFLLEKNNWKGLILDAGHDQIESVRKSKLYWQHDLKAVCAFINSDNINDLLRGQGVRGDIGLLSIDIDGNDYWVWQAIDCIQPRIVICEYNALFGPTQKLVVPYDPEFTRENAHYTRCFFGASLAALESLGRQKGYSLIGSNSAGNNAFFLRRDLLGGFQPLTAGQAYRQPRFREARDRSGNLSYTEFALTQAAIGDMMVVDLDKGLEVRLADALNL